MNIHIHYLIIMRIYIYIYVSYIRVSCLFVIYTYFIINCVSISTTYIRKQPNNLRIPRTKKKREEIHGIEQWPRCGIATKARCSIIEHICKSLLMAFLGYHAIWRWGQWAVPIPSPWESDEQNCRQPTTKRFLFDLLWDCFQWVLRYTSTNMFCWTSLKLLQQQQKHRKQLLSPLRFCHGLRSFVPLKVSSVVQSRGISTM